jgi:hypothetical protein
MRYWLGCIAFLILNASSVQCAVSAPDLKGAMIQRIATFVGWPSCGRSDVVIGVYDDPDSFEKFKNLYRNQTILGRPIAVRAFDQISQLDVLANCDILCIGEISTSQRSKILQKLAKSSVLIVGNSRGDAEAGVSLVLLEEGNRYRILINQEALKNANLRADYRLLKLAELVEGK